MNFHAIERRLRETGFQRHIDERFSVWQNTASVDPLVIVMGFGFLALGVMVFIVAGHHAGFFIVHELGHRLLPSSVWANITFTGDTLMVLTLLLLLGYRWPQVMFAAWIGALCTTLCIHGLKQGFDLARPPSLLALEQFQLIGPAFKRVSFPSGHTASAFLLATVLTGCVQQPLLKAFFLVAAGFVGWSRVVCGVHWPVDVLVGAGIGVLCGCMALILSQRYRINQWAYIFACGLCVVAAVLLREHDGGMASVEGFSHFTSGVCLVHFVGFLLLHLYRTLLLPRRQTLSSDAV